MLNYESRGRVSETGAARMENNCGGVETHRRGGRGGDAGMRRWRLRGEDRVKGSRGGVFKGEGPGISVGKQGREGRGFMAGDLAPSCYSSEERVEEGGEADVWGQAVSGGVGECGAGECSAWAEGEGELGRASACCGAALSGMGAAVSAGRSGRRRGEQARFAGPGGAFLGREERGSG